MHIFFIHFYKSIDSKVEIRNFIFNHQPNSNFHLTCYKKITTFIERRQHIKSGETARCSNVNLR